MSGDLGRVFGFLCVFRGVLGNVTVLRVLYDVGFGGLADPVLLSKHRSLLVGLGLVEFVGRGRYRLGFVSLELFRFLYWVGYHYLHFFYSDPDEFLDKVGGVSGGSSGSGDRSVGGTSISEDAFESVWDRVGLFGLGDRYRVLFEDADSWVYVRVGMGVVLGVFWRDPFCLRFWILYSLSSGSLSRRKILGRVNEYVESFSVNCEDLPRRLRASKDNGGSKDKEGSKSEGGLFTEQNVYKMIKRLLFPSWSGELKELDIDLYKWAQKMDYRGLGRVRLGFVKQHGASSYGAKLSLTDFGKVFLEQFWELVSGLYLPKKLLNHVRFINSAASKGTLKPLLGSYVRTLLESLREYSEDKDIIKRFFLFLNEEAFNLLIKNEDISGFLGELGINIIAFDKTRGALGLPFVNLSYLLDTMSSGAMSIADVADLLVRSKSSIESDDALKSRLISALTTYLETADLREVVRLMKELYGRGLRLCEFLDSDLCRILVSKLSNKISAGNADIKVIVELLEVLYRHDIILSSHEDLERAILRALTKNILAATPRDLAKILHAFKLHGINLDKREKLKQAFNAVLIKKINVATPSELADILMNLAPHGISFDAKKIGKAIREAIMRKFDALFEERDFLGILEGLLLIEKIMRREGVEDGLLLDLKKKFLSALGALDPRSLIDFVEEAGRRLRRDLWGVLVEDRELYEGLLDLLVKKLRKEVPPEELPDYIAGLPQDLQAALLGRLF